MDDPVGHLAEVWYNNPNHDPIDRAGELLGKAFATWCERIAKDIEAGDFQHLWHIYYDRNYAS